jgi:drug/metabolite transporter (DMT)-like permease
VFGTAVWLFISVMTGHELSLLVGIGCCLAGAVAAAGALIATERVVMQRAVHAVKRPVS